MHFDKFVLFPKYIKKNKEDKISNSEAPQRWCAAILILNLLQQILKTHSKNIFFF